MTEENAYIVLRREPKWVYKIRRFDIVIDDEKVGSIANGQEEVLSIAPGRHEIELKVSWVIKSQVQIVELKPGEKVLLECGTPLSLLRFIPLWLSVSAVFMDHRFVKTFWWLFVPLALYSAGYGIWLYKGKGRFISLNEPKPYVVPSEKLIAPAN